MKMARLFVVLTTLSLAATAQADSSYSKVWMYTGFENAQPSSDRPKQGSESFSRTERGYYSEKPALESSLLAALSDPKGPRIRVKIDNLNSAAVGAQDAVSPQHATVGGPGETPAPAQRDLGPGASMNISFQPEGNASLDAPSSYLSVDNTDAGAAQLEGNPSGVPEPDTMLLLGFGLLALAGIGRRFTRT